MDIETPYDEELEFITCTICDRSIRGETLFKIHLTTAPHIKKEDSLVAMGQAVRRQHVPEFTNIVQYLDYLKLDEPIIGLTFLEEVPSNDPASPNYSCELCHLTANMAEMVRHVIGRKHRQKYVELKRQDLVTWDKQSLSTQGGKVMRARAEIIERQDGRGTPKMLMVKKRTDTKLNISRGPPRQNQNRDGRIPLRTPHDVPPLLPELKDYQSKISPRRMYPPDYPNTPTFHPDVPNMDRDRPSRWEDSLRQDRTAEEVQKADYRERSTYREDRLDSDYRRQYEGDYVEEPRRSVVLKPDDDSRHDYREAPCAKYYPGERSYPERDPLKEFYTEEVNRAQVRSAKSAEFQPSKLGYPEGDKQQWPLERDSGRHDPMNRAGRQGSREPEDKWRNFTPPAESDRSRDHLFSVIRDYHHKMGGPYQEDKIDSPGPSRAAAPTTQSRAEATRTFSDIPEPFRRFLTGADNEESRGKRKRKSRFSDATPEELEMTKEILRNEHGPPNPKFGGDSRAVTGSLRPEFSGAQYSDHMRKSQSPNYSDSYQRGSSESDGVFDMLRNIDIENAEEADFLKNKLFSLLKEFKSKKLEKVVTNRQSMGSMSNDYTQPPRQDQYERTLREDSDRRPSEDLYSRDDNRRGWKQWEHVPEQRPQEYHHPERGEPRHSSRSRFEEDFGGHLDQRPSYSERFQEPRRPQDYQPAAQEFFDSRSSQPPLQTDLGPRMNRGSRYSNNLDKITSTLLEFVSRK
ncbi:uncharacterized protein si:ch211-13c6.2 isoform X2 [Mugil cephalus]|uniref:uncharacterized protein si:ch211-13c6.2 isoform X2 n=1 Tax=Mugil cephalus TaxID=48193 RepID=UPI001FB68336|nr:uncharacterized protein si:ch211-13c6.2 isoform X2 [Mugil cephalus]